MSFKPGMAALPSAFKKGQSGNPEGARRGRADPRNSPDHLTDHQRKVVLAYIERRNAAEAYRQVSGSTSKWARGEGRRIVNLPAAQKMIAEADCRIVAAQERAMTKYEVTEERLIQRLAVIAFGDPRDVYQWTADGRVSLIASDQITDEAALSINEISETTSKGKRELRAKQLDAIRATELLMRHKRMLTDKVEHTGAIGITISQDDADL